MITIDMHTIFGMNTRTSVVYFFRGNTLKSYYPNLTDATVQRLAQLTHTSAHTEVFISQRSVRTLSQYNK